jgi:hypothetical protein
VIPNSSLCERNLYFISSTFISAHPISFVWCGYLGNQSVLLINKTSSFQIKTKSQHQLSTMVQTRTFLINEGMSKTMPLELQSLRIDDEWKTVMHPTIDDFVEMTAFGKKLQCCLFASFCFLFCTIPYAIWKANSMETEFMNKMRRRYVFILEIKATIKY